MARTWDRTAADLSTALQEVYRGHGERLELAVVDLLRADSFIASYFKWEGDVSAVLRVTGVRDFPAKPWPMILVYGIQSQRELQVGNEYEITYPIGVTLLFDETRTELGEDDRAVGTFADYITKVLSSDAAVVLQVERWYDESDNPRPTVGRLDRLAVVGFGPALRREEYAIVQDAEARGVTLPTTFQPSGLFLDVQMDYKYTVARTTMTPDNFDPEE